MSDERKSFENAGGEVDDIGKGAYFWVDISDETAKLVTDWSVTFTQGEWIGRIDSEMPQRSLQTDGLTGEFDVEVKGSGPDLSEQRLEPEDGCRANIGCNENCASMVSITASSSGGDDDDDEVKVEANYCTTWDAFCR